MGGPRWVAHLFFVDGMMSGGDGSGGGRLLCVSEIILLIRAYFVLCQRFVCFSASKIHTKKP